MRKRNSASCLASFTSPATGTRTSGGDGRAALTLLRSGRPVAVLLVCALLTVCLAGCGSSSGERPNVSVPLLTVRDALAAADGTSVAVQGMLVAEAERVVLASALLESYPPQAGGEVLPLEGLKVENLVGLSTSKGSVGVEPVTWSDYPVVLTGTLRGGALAVTGVPVVTEAFLDVGGTSSEAGPGGKVRVRFAVASEPLAKSGTVWWLFDIANLTSASLDLVFATGQRGEVVLRTGGQEVYRWSKGKLFTQAVQVVSLNPGDLFSIVLNDIYALGAGDYELEAQVSATVGLGKVAKLTLPGLSRRLSVR